MSLCIFWETNRLKSHLRRRRNKGTSQSITFLSNDGNTTFTQRLSYSSVRTRRTHGRWVISGYYLIVIMCTVFPWLRHSHVNWKATAHDLYDTSFARSRDSCSYDSYSHRLSIYLRPKGSCLQPLGLSLLWSCSSYVLTMLSLCSVYALAIVTWVLI